MLTDFITVQGYNCILGNISNTLKYFRIDIAEPDLFFAFSAFQGGESMRGVFDTFYVDRGKLDWLCFVEQCLAEQHPVLISIDAKVLPYIKFTIGDSLTKHYINIIGIDVEKKRLYVSDSYVPTYTPSVYTGWIDYSDISDMQIENCWRIKNSVLQYFQEKCRRNEYQEYIFDHIIQRLSHFLRGDKVNDTQPGIEKLYKLQDLILINVQNENYEEIFKLLAGVRLNIITPLVYLRFALERKQMRYQELVKLLDSFTNNYWEMLNIQLIKFSIAHKILDYERVSEQIKNNIIEEQAVLNVILERLISEKSKKNEDYLK